MRARGHAIHHSGSGGAQGQVRAVVVATRSIRVSTGSDSGHLRRPVALIRQLARQTLDYAFSSRMI